MENKKFKVGDKVHLISGGPNMTVREYVNGNLVHCDWFAKDEYKSHNFHEEQLKIYEYVGPVFGTSTRRSSHW